ncbi:hypothetical protein BCR36DRAFT_314784, partial [Piromyces finnis]
MISYRDWEHLVLNKKRKKEHKEYKIRKSSQQQDYTQNHEKNRIVSPPTSFLKNRKNNMNGNHSSNSNREEPSEYLSNSHNYNSSDIVLNETKDNNSNGNNNNNNKSKEENTTEVSMESLDASADITTQVNNNYIDYLKPNFYNSSTKLIKTDSGRHSYSSNSDLNIVDMNSYEDIFTNSISLISSVSSSVSSNIDVTEDDGTINNSVYSNNNNNNNNTNNYVNMPSEINIVSEEEENNNNIHSNYNSKELALNNSDVYNNPIMRRNPTKLEFKSLEEVEKEDNEKMDFKNATYESSTKSYDGRKHRHNSIYTLRVYFFFPNLIFYSRFFSYTFYFLDMILSFLLSLAYLPYVFLGFYIYGIIEMKKTIPEDQNGWVLENSFELLKGTCSFLLGSCGYLIYQSIKYYKVKAIIKKEKKKRKKTLKLTFYKKLKNKTYKKKEGNQLRGDTQISVISKNSDLILSHENSGSTHIQINSSSTIDNEASDISNIRRLNQHKTTENEVQFRDTDLQGMSISSLPPPSSSPQKINYHNRKTRKINKMDENVYWKPRLKHIYPQYTYWLKNNISNYFQIITIVIQVFQLINFPIEDIYNNPLLQISIHEVYKPIKWFTKVSNYFTSLFIVKKTPEASPFIFITIWWLTLILTVAYIIFYFMNYLIINKYVSRTEHPKLYRNIKRISGLKWNSCLIPIFNISYIAILFSYINTLSCLLNWNSSLTSATDRYERCLYVTMKPGFFINYFIIGFSISYLVLSAIVISNEPLSEPGMIAFTSRSVIIIKHTNLLIMIMYNILQIVVSEWKKSVIFHVIRCVGAIIVTILSVIYIAYVGTCYIRIVDAWRVYSQLLVVWACCISLIFAISPDGSNDAIFSIYKVFGREQSPAVLFSIGFIIISVIVFLCFRIYFNKHPGGVGEDGKPGHGTKSYTEAFLPRRNNVTISTLKNLLLNNIKHHKKHSSEEKKQNNEDQESFNSKKNSFNDSNPQLPVIPNPRLLYLQDEYKYITDD